MKKYQKTIIREYISCILREQSSKTGQSAGIIVVKKFNDTWKPLTLIWKNKFDIPKGGIEPGETTYEAAVRETYEESQIDNLDFIWGFDFLKVENLTVYVAATTQEPKIVENPETGNKEHDMAMWVDWDILIARGSPKISIAAQWARIITSKNNLL